MDEIIVSGYCRTVDGNRMLCCEVSEEGGCETDCLYPSCEFASVCGLVKKALEKANKQ